ncbi:MAG: HAMP domain-containing protein [Bacteroidales bacterium]
MKIKTKLIFGFVFLLSEFLIVSLCSLYFIFKISQQNNLISRDNNLSIGYAENMLQSIDRINEIRTSSIFNIHFLSNESEFSGLIKDFENNLIKEEQNITETGEKELVKSVRDNFEKFKILLTESDKPSIKDKPGFYYANILPTVKEMKFALFAVSDLNMNAIVRKNVKANNTANHSYIVLSIVSSICFLVFFSLIFSFPKYIAEPIEILARNAKEIADRNNPAHVYFNSDDEFGQISKSFNEIADRLEEYEKVEIGQLINAKARAESIINKMDEPVIILDELQNITLVNILAEKLLGLNQLNIVNKNASEIASTNELFRFMIKDLNQDSIKQAETFTLTMDGIKTIYKTELNKISTYNKKRDFIVPLGYMFSLKKVSKVFD